MFFSTWDDVFRVLVVGMLGYAGLVILLRLTGNRTLSQMNSFDFVVTVAFGSTLSSLLIDSKIPLAIGLTGIALLIVLQYVITWLSVRSNAISSLVKTSPTLLLAHGRFLPAAMKKARVTENEIRASLRKHGYGGIEQVSAVILESDGTLSVVAQQQQGSLSAMDGVDGWPPQRRVEQDW